MAWEEEDPPRWGGIMEKLGSHIFSSLRRRWRSCGCQRPLHLARGYLTLTMSEFFAMMEPRANWATTAAGDVGYKPMANVLGAGAAETAILVSMQTVDIVPRCVPHPRLIFFPETRHRHH